MKQIVISFLFLFSWVQIGCNGKPAISDSAKQPAGKLNLGVGSEISAYCGTIFIGTEYAWLPRLDGGLIRTRNGGVSWESTSPEAAGTFLSMSFIDANHGWALDKEAGIWRTSDSGQTWAQVSRLFSQDNMYLQHQIQFVDDLHGWVIDPFSVWSSVDGGATWKQTITKNYIGEGRTLAKGHFISPKVGWLVGHKGELLQTRDGGVNWKVKKSSSDEGRITSIFFLEADTGWVATDSSAGTSSDDLIKGIYYSDDGGSSWQLKKALNENTNIDSIHFAGPIGWAVGNEWVKGTTTPYESRGILLRTLDKGQSWQSIQVPLGERYFYNIYFADSMQGWLSAERRIYRTNDGGKTWNSVLGMPLISIKD